MLQIEAQTDTSSGSRRERLAGPLAAPHVLSVVPPTGTDCLPASMRNMLVLTDAHNQYMQDRVDLIASNTYVSRWVKQILSSSLTNSYTPGTPGNRLFGGCAYIDMLEREVASLARQAFGMLYVSAEFLSGMQANTAAYHALLEPGDTVVSGPRGTAGTTATRPRVHCAGSRLGCCPRHSTRPHITSTWPAWRCFSPPSIPAS